MSVYSYGIVLGLVGLLVNAGVISPAYALELEAPCISAPTKEEIARQKQKGPHAGQRLCKDVMPELKKLTEDLVRERAELLYNGCDLDAERGALISQCLGRKGNEQPRETCNPLETPGVPKTFNRQVERENNHSFDFKELEYLGFPEKRRAGAKCGDWPFFKTRIRGRSCRISATYPENGNYLEGAYNRGAFIQALNCFHQQVQYELDKGKVLLTTIRVPDGNGGFIEQDSVCSTMAKVYEEQKASTEPGKNLNLGSAENLEEIEDCTGFEKINSKELNSDRGRLRQSACQLRAARDALEKAFASVVACEIGIRASNSYVGQFIGSSVTKDEISSAAQKAGHGRKGKSKQCNHNWVLNKFYKPAYWKKFQSKAEQIWNAQTCGPRAQ
ncbi:MAG: hypothetical protein NDJ90_09295 [Oligoflexia bacterium]|nr:hypothetical protein [Oligoflexia bacterium]